MAKEVKLLQVALQPQFVVEVDGKPAQVVGPQQPIVVFAADWDAYKLPVEQMVQEILQKIQAGD